MPYFQKGNITIITIVAIIVVGLLTVLVGSKLLIVKKTPPQTPVVVKQKDKLPKVFESKELGFEFKYPYSGYLVIDDDEEKFSNHAQAEFRKNFKNYVGFPPPQFIKGLIVKAADPTHPDQFEPTPLTLWVFNNPNNLSIERWYELYWYYPFVWGQFSQPQKGQVSPKNEASVSGQLAKYGVVSYRPGEPKFVYLSRNGRMFLFRLMDEGKRSTGEEILTSFKFKL